MFSFFCRTCNDTKVGIVREMKLTNRLEWTSDEKENKIISVIEFLITQGIFDRIYNTKIQCTNCQKVSDILTFLKLQ